jgi:hypothetical protein
MHTTYAVGTASLNNIGINEETTKILIINYSVLKLFRNVKTTDTDLLLSSIFFHVSFFADYTKAVHQTQSLFLCERDITGP